MSTLRAVQISFAALVELAVAAATPRTRRSRSLARGHAVVVVRCRGECPVDCSMQLGPGVTVAAVLRTLRLVAEGNEHDEGLLCRIHGYVDRREGGVHGGSA